MTKQEIEINIQSFISSKKVYQKIVNTNLPIPPKPPNSETLFQEWDQIKAKYGTIAEVPYHVLGNYLDRWASLIAYARWAEASADINQATSREIRDVVKKQLYSLQEGSRETKDALVYTEDLYIKWEKQYIEDLTTYIMVKALREGYEQRMNAISREITRRGDDFKDVNRSCNI